MALPGNVLKTSKVGDSSIHLINLYPSLLMEKFFLISCLNVPSHNWWLLSMKLVTKLWRVSLHSSCNSSSGSCGLQLDLSLPHNLLFVTQNKSQIKSKSVALGFSFCGGLLQGLLLLLSHLLELWRGKPDMTFQLLLYQHWVKKYNNFFWSAGHMLYVASTKFVLSVIRVCCWLIFNLAPTITKSFSARQKCL